MAGDEQGGPGAGRPAQASGQLGVPRLDRAPRPLAGAVVLLTGASSGIGRATALLLAGLGASVLAAGRDAGALAEVAAATGAIPLAADLGDEAGRAGLVARALEPFGRVDVLVNNAGVGAAGPLGTVDHPRLAAMVAVNLTAPVALTAALLPGMIERGRGHVVNVASIVGITGNKDETAYSATKAGLVGFTRSLRQELAGTGVRVSLVVPGVIDTPFFARRGRPYQRAWPRPLPPERAAAAIATVLRTGRPELFVPAWMRLPAGLARVAPGLYERLATRFG
jgi:NAD(P)-dependent dehydrogenase (short-subunit alcohol dehydrogenase family)